MTTEVVHHDSTPPPPRPPASTSAVWDVRRHAKTSDAERRDLARKLVIVAALRIALVSASLGASIALMDLTKAESNADIGTWEYTLIAAAYAVSLIYALALRYSDHVLPLAYAQVVVDSMLVTWLVLMTGGSESVFSFAYVFVVLGAAMTLYRQGAAVGTLLSLLLFGTLVLLQLEGVFTFLPRLEDSPAALSFFVYALGFGLVGFLSSTLAETARSRARALAVKESEFEQLEELQASILRSLPAGLMTVDGDGVIRYVNESALAILRYRPRDAIGHGLRTVVPPIAEPWKRLYDGQRIPNPRDRFEGNFVRQDRSIVRIGFSFAPLSRREQRSGVIVVFQDVTDIVRLKDAVERAERLATVGKIAAALAHEIRNPLSSMCASVDVLRQTLNPPEEMFQLMENIVREGERLNGLVTDFLEFARPRDPDLRNADASELVAGVIEMFKHEATLSRCQITSRLEPSLTVSIDPDAIRQVIWNLARNAAQAMTRGSGEIAIMTRSVGEYAEIVIRDTGVGMSRQTLKRIFDPFFTTKDEGTGLGLAVAHSIVEAHAGQILVSSREGEGTEFTVRLLRLGAMDQQGSPDDTDPALNVKPSNFEFFGGPL